MERIYLYIYLSPLSDFLFGVETEMLPHMLKILERA